MYVCQIPLLFFKDNENITQLLKKSIYWEKKKENMKEWEYAKYESISTMCWLVTNRKYCCEISLIKKKISSRAFNRKINKIENSKITFPDDTKRPRRLSFLRSNIGIDAQNNSEKWYNKQ